MKIVYLCTTMTEQDFADYLPLWSKAPNPSNQNFHNKMIRALAEKHEVTVISFRPFSKSLVNLPFLPYEEKKEGNINWIYLKIHRNIFKKLWNIDKQVKDAFEKCLTSDSILFVDTINTLSVHFSKVAMNKYHCKSVGIVTDSPSNISAASKSFSKYLLSSAGNYSGYIALTDSLNSLFNHNDRPHEIIEGIVETNPYVNHVNKEKNIFFGGALMERYGIYNLINAFKNLDDCGYKLQICGHHADLNTLNNVIGKTRNIEYLGCLTVEQVRKYEASAYACINPRPFSEDLDRYSIPSKTIEYLTSGNLVISVKNTRLQKIFPNELIWAKSSDVSDLTEVLKKAISLDKESYKIITKSAYEKVKELYSFKTTNDKVDSLLEKINS